jgi:hypothetical protein
MVGFERLTCSGRAVRVSREQRLIMLTDIYSKDYDQLLASKVVCPLSRERGGAVHESSPSVSVFIYLF